MANETMGGFQDQRPAISEASGADEQMLENQHAHGTQGNVLCSILSDACTCLLSPERE